MLISKVPDNDGGMGEGLAATNERTDAHEYHTANELFELMAKNQNFDTSDVDKLSTRDLVLLYKNIDLGTKLMSNANELKRSKPNQYVETVVYNDEPESDGSDVSDIYSNEDLHNVFLVNKERIDLLETPASVENTLCHKLGDLEIQTSDLTTEYDRNFLFKDPYIKEQLKSFKFMNNATESEGTVLPASLLDYICCKRLEDNYNFYMDNIIRYVKHTIEQLKRISNGDYLTDKAKEKWREVENVTEDPHTNAKVLATSTSIPLHVERKVGGRKSTWDDIVHSAVDIRSLSKILEKKIVVEVPKIICGSYKLMSKCCADNLIISCKKEKRSVEETNAESRVDVVFQLQRSETGQVMSNISSIMILQTSTVVCDTQKAEIALPMLLPCEELKNDSDSSLERKVQIVELEQIDTDETFDESCVDTDRSDRPVEDTYLGSIDVACSDNDGTPSLKNTSYEESSDSCDVLREILDEKLMSAKEAVCDVFPDDLLLTIQKLTMQGALTEESGEDMSQPTATKKKSPTRVRIKSPYENQSLIMEEKKRRKLLEIRERREKKKMALAENCKITKHKFGKGAIMPQSSSSVTKLSITNKSFYNSIYGQSTNTDPNKQAKGKNPKGKQEVIDMGLEALDSLDGEHDMPILTPERNSKKYINRSYYLDDAVTEMMYTNMKQNEGKELCSTSTSVISNDFRNNLNLLSQLICPSDTELNIGDDDVSPDDKINMLSPTNVDEGNGENCPKVVTTPQSILKTVPSNALNIKDHADNNDSKKITSSFECRKSIDKIYTLMNKSGNAQNTEGKSSKNKSAASNIEKCDVNEGLESSTFQGSDSGTSLKHHLTSSNPSNFSFDKNNTEVVKPSHTSNESAGNPTYVIPKVIISSKSSQSQQNDTEKNKKDRRKSGNSPKIKVPENPLKAISQLLHEFENVQKTRHRPVTEQKSAKKMDIISSEGRSGSRQIYFNQGSLIRRSRLEQHNDTQTDMYPRVTTSKEKKTKPIVIPYQQSAVDDKHVEKMPKKKIADLLDEAKEARGEAVRGPSKPNSRLNSLAQPKRTYVQAHSEEYQTKYGKTLMADRLQRLAAAVPSSASSRGKAKRSGTEAVSAVSVKPPPPSVPPLERAGRTRHSSSSSPEPLNQGVGQTFKQIPVPETPQLLKKKMVAVESYVKNHYQRALFGSDSQSAQKSRAPLVPSDIELESSTSSPQQSTELGSRLHHIVNTIIKNTSQGLEVLTECHESTSKISKENSDDYSLAESLSRSEHVSSDSEYIIDILNDNNVQTSVEKIDISSVNEQKKINVGVTDATLYDLQPIKSVTEIEKLENALCHISVGTFQKRLRIKNLTLTPKQSMQQVFLLQSGDAGSLLVQTPTTQNLRETKTDNFPDLKALPVLSKSHLDWSFTNFPMQISTVGFAFPEYKSIQRGSTSLVQLLDKASKSSEEENSSHNISRKSDKDNQCFKGRQPELHLEQAAQVDVSAATFITSSTQPMESKKKEEIKLSKHVFIDFSENKTVDSKDPLKVDATPTKVLPENKETDSAVQKTESIEYTTSLDILVGLLNEIQKITTCQTQMTNGGVIRDENQQSTKLETILNNAAAVESSIKNNPYDVLSFTSLDRLRQLESNQSLYSFYLSDNEWCERKSSVFNFPTEIFPMNINTNKLLCPEPIYADKEVSVHFVERELINRCTDVPSQIFPVSMNHSKNVTNSVVGVLSEPSTQSMLSLTEYHSVCTSNTSSLDHKNLKQIPPQIIITRKSNQPLAVYELKKRIEKQNETKSIKKKIQSFEKDRVKKNGKVTNAKFHLKTDFDPIMKMKRDILVTVYSILVFTVFAALSFPEILYRV